MAGFALVGCSRTVVYKQGQDPDVVVVEKKRPVTIDDRNGPPSHAPAHGYRRKHSGKDGSVILIYDRRLQVYVVESSPDCYYSAGQYFRKGDTGWQWSVELSGPWHSVEMSSDIPPGLRRNHGRVASGSDSHKDPRAEPKKGKDKKDKDPADKKDGKGKDKKDKDPADKNGKDKGKDGNDKDDTGKDDDTGDSDTGDSDTGDSDTDGGDTGGGDTGR
jgi:hypothetical protein